MDEEAGNTRVPIETIPKLCTRQLVADPNLAIPMNRIAGEAGLDRPINHPRVQKSGLALAGHHQGVVPTRVQLLGETELSYLGSLTPDGRSVASRGFFALGLSCVVVSGALEPPPAFVAAAEATTTPLFVTTARSSRAINALHAVLDDRLAPQTQLHGVLVDVYRIGVLLLGKSGIGKSECALELLIRGHQLIADDVVRCEWHPPGILFGQPAALLKHQVEVRGLGVLDARELFGITAVRDRKQIDLVVRLCDWNDEEEFDRLGLEDRHHTILGTPIREVRVPVRPGRDMGSIIEMAARNELLRRDGRNTAREFVGKIEGGIVPHPGADRAGESSIPAPVATDLKGGPSPSWSVLAPQARTTESSAWIPAVRPRKGRDE
jgi:HPr kinase/phosphorylase